MNPRSEIKNAISERLRILAVKLERGEVVLDEERPQVFARHLANAVLPGKTMVRRTHTAIVRQVDVAIALRQRSRSGIAKPLKRTTDQSIGDHNVDQAVSELAELEASLYTQSPRTKALLRGVQLKRDWLSALGGSIPTSDLATAMGITTKSVNKKRTQREILGLPLANSFAYPAWQFDSNFRPLKGLNDVLLSMESSPAFNSDWTMLKFFVERNETIKVNLGEAITPAEALQKGKLADVLLAVHNYLTHGAV